MHYKVLKVYNNNVVLAEEPGGKQIVLIGKGVGFGARKGDLINGDDPDNKVFSILDESVNPSEIKRLNYDIEKVEKVTQEIVEIAREKLDITNDKLYDALYDHIAFAIERLKMGLPIDNPFIGEIAIMCSREFEVAEIAAKLIRREVDVDIGEPEKGFIALHLYSARRNKHINTAMKNARFYKQAVLVVGRCFGRTLRHQLLRLQKLPDQPQPPDQLRAARRPARDARQTVCPAGHGRILPRRAGGLRPDETGDRRGAF